MAIVVSELELPSELHNLTVRTDFYNYNVSQAFDLSTYPVSRFTNEFGFQSHSSYQTYARFMSKDQLSFNSSTILHRNRHYETSAADLANSGTNTGAAKNQTEQSLSGMAQMSNGAEIYYPTPHKRSKRAMFKAQIYASQLFQAEFVRSQIEYYRHGSGLRQRNLGSLYWQLNEIWASPTWASVDVLGRWKLLAHLAQQSYSSVIIAPYVETWGTFGQLMTVSVTSDLWESVNGTARLTWYDWAGKPLDTNRSWEYPVSVGAINSTRLPFFSFISVAELPDDLKLGVAVLDANVTTANGTTYSAERVWTPSRLSDERVMRSFVDPKLSVTYNASTKQFTVKSSAVAGFVWLEHPEGVKGRFSDNAFWMLPGKKSVSFILEEDRTKGDWVNKVSVRSVWDLTTP